MYWAILVRHTEPYFKITFLCDLGNSRVLTLSSIVEFLDSLLQSAFEENVPQVGALVIAYTCVLTGRLSSCQPFMFGQPISLQLEEGWYYPLSFRSEIQGTRYETRGETVAIGRRRSNG